VRIFSLTTTVMKDADFSDRVLLGQPPPRVIHIKFGNMKMREFHQTISKVWDEVCELSEQHSLGRVFNDRIDAVV